MKKKKRRKQLRRKLGKRLKLKRQRCLYAIQPKPRYDEVYYEGLEWLNSL